MLKVAKFGGSSVAGAEQFQKVRHIVEADPARRIVVASAAGKRFSDDHKLTDLLYLCHAHLTYGVSCDDILASIRSRFVGIRDALELRFDIEDAFDAYAARLSRDWSATTPSRAWKYRTPAEQVPSGRQPASSSSMLRVPQAWARSSSSVEIPQA